MAKVNIKGVIIPNDYKWFYDYLGWDSTCPNDVQTIIDKVLEKGDGENIEVYINSPGGVISAGSEIYSILRVHESIVKIYIPGEACSAASVIAMAAYCEMSPTALMMVHCTSTYAGGNHNDMEHVAGVLKTADEAIASAYMAKSGMSQDEVIAMMEKETWLTAERAKEKGLIDGVMFEQKEPLQLVASTFQLPTQEQMDRVKNLIKKQTEPEEPENPENPEDKSAFLIQAETARARLNLLKLKGEHCRD